MSGPKALEKAANRQVRLNLVTVKTFCETRNYFI